MVFKEYCYVQTFAQNLFFEYGYFKSPYFYWLQLWPNINLAIVRMHFLPTIQKTNLKKLLSPYRIILLSVITVIIAVITMLNLQVEIMPKTHSKTLTVSFHLPESSPDIVEQQVISILENALSQLSPLKKIRSIASYNGGNVQLDFANNVDLAFKKLEITTILRRIYQQLPKGISNLYVSGGNTSPDGSPILIYSIAAPLQSFKLKDLTETVFSKAFTKLSEIKNVVVSGGSSLQIAIRFNKEKCQAWKIDPRQIKNEITNRFSNSYPGYISEKEIFQYFLNVTDQNASIASIENITIPNPYTKDLRIKDIAKVYFQETSPESYIRINGKNAITLSIYANEGENKLLAAQKAKSIIKNVQLQLPESFELRQEYDDTRFLKEEMNKNYRRIFLSVAILAIFILSVYRSFPIFINFFVGLLITISLSIIVIWLVKLPIHLYTIAGVVIAFGIAVANSIIMLDNVYRKSNKKMLLALLGAVLTTVVSLCLVYFLPEEERGALTDFATIIIIMLMASLVAAQLLTPSLYHFLRKINAVEKKRQKIKKVPRIELIYKKIFLFTVYHRKLFIIALILLIGTPFFLLPSRINGDKWYHQLYNSSLGNKYYLKNIRPDLDKYLGGSLKSFLEKLHEKAGTRDYSQTMLYVQAELPIGNTLAQMDKILKEFENTLSLENGVDKFVTKIHSGQYGAISITFSDKASQSLLPSRLKSQLVNQSLNWGGVKWNIYGVGKGFSNASNEDTPSFTLLMKGYNYDELDKLTTLFAEKLSTAQRVQKINTNSRLNASDKESNEYILSLDDNRLAKSGINKYQYLDALNKLALPSGYSGNVLINNQLYSLIFSDVNAESYSNYDLLYNNIYIDSNTIVRTNNIGSLEFRKTSSSIYKENRQYIRVISFEYLGPSEAAKRYLVNKIEEMEKEMPMGYSFSSSGLNSTGSSNRANYYIIILFLLVAIFFISCIIFESFKYPFLIIAIILISFIGLFLTFSIGFFHFDQGGCAAFVLIGGVVANGSILFINNHNLLKKRFNIKDHNLLILLTLRIRLRTIFLTFISTCASMIPFLIEGEKEVFWFSLAIGVIGGLIVSVFALLFCLPVFLWKRNKKYAN